MIGSSYRGDYMHPMHSARLSDLITRHAGAGITPTALPGLVVMRAETTTTPLGHNAKPSLAFVIGGAKQVWLGEQLMRYGAGQYLTVGAELPVTAHISEASSEAPFLGFGFELEAEVIAALLLEAGTPGLGSEAAPAGMGVADLDAPLLDALERLLGLLDEPAQIPGLAPAYRREVLWRLLTGPLGELIRQVGLADSRLTHISRALRHLHEHFDEPIRIEQLAELSAMSPATFHRHFRAVTQMTPIGFQKQLRLQAARRRLMSDPGDVAGAGFAVGYESASQFSREYRRMFGVPPGRDAQTLRATAATAVATL
jgi:AraC-like DNA-binding protein